MYCVSRLKIKWSVKRGGGCNIIAFFWYFIFDLLARERVSFFFLQLCWEKKIYKFLARDTLNFDEVGEAWIQTNYNGATLGVANVQLVFNTAAVSMNHFVRPYVYLHLSPWISVVGFYITLMKLGRPEFKLIITEQPQWLQMSSLFFFNTAAVSMNNFVSPFQWTICLYAYFEKLMK